MEEEIKKISKPKRSELNVEVRKIGGSLWILVPNNIDNLMEIKEGTRLEMDVNDRKYGKRLSIWNYKQQIKKYNEKIEKVVNAV